MAARADEPEKRLRLAVAGFEAAADLNERDQWIPAAIEVTLTWRLRRVPALVGLPSVRVQQAQRELKDSTDQTVPWARVARQLGAQRLLTGSCGGPPHAVVLKLELHALDDTSAPPRSTELAPGRLFDVIDEATRWTLSALGVGPLDEDTQELVFAPPCKSPSGLEYYAKAVLAARSENLRDTIHYTSEAIGYDARYRPALSMLSQIELRVSASRRRSAGQRLRLLAELSRRAHDPIHRTEAELNLGVLLILSGNHEAALKRFENALALGFETGDIYGQIATINRICDLYLVAQPPPTAELSEDAAKRFTQNNLRRAAEWQELLLDILEELADAVGETPAANKLALIYERRGETELALAAHQRTLDAATRTGSLRNQAAAWMFIGQSHRKQQRWAEALDATSRCLALASDATKPAARVALAGIYRAMEKPLEALAQYELAYEQVADSEDMTNQFVCLREIASLRMELGQREPALVALRDAIDIAHVLNHPEEKAMKQRLELWMKPPQP